MSEEEQHYRNHYHKDAEIFYYTNSFQGDTLIENQRLHENILRYINQNDKNILDIGCGGAWLAQKLLPLDKYVISADISFKNPYRAFKMFPYQNHIGIVGDVFHIPIRQDSMDVIVAAEIIEHVNAPQAFIEKLFDVLKPGGGN
jgi:2-polyprenyl-3-methyl-5-hydroxy-6-metoxy-1,4-benzoquinol methylase